MSLLKWVVDIVEACLGVCGLYWVTLLILTTSDGWWLFGLLTGIPFMIVGVLGFRSFLKRPASVAIQGCVVGIFMVWFVWHLVGSIANGSLFADQPYWGNIDQVIYKFVFVPILILHLVTFPARIRDQKVKNSSEKKI